MVEKNDMVSRRWVLCLAFRTSSALCLTVTCMFKLRTVVSEGSIIDSGLKLTVLLRCRSCCAYPKKPRGKEMNLALDPARVMWYALAQGPGACVTRIGGYAAA